MKKVLLLSFVLSASFAVCAQETEQIPATRVLPEVRNKEIGIMAHQSYDQPGVNMVGVQYKQYKNERYGMRIMAAYGNYSASARTTARIVQDTVIEKHASTKINLPVVGVGVEMQRQFYKLVHLYAAVELRGGYGRGRVDTISIARYNDLNNSISDLRGPWLQEDVSMLHIAAVPSVGAKLQTRKISVGIEMMPAQMIINSLTYSKAPAFSSLDLRVGAFEHRIFINYRF